DTNYLPLPKGLDPASVAVLDLPLNDLHKGAVDFYGMFLPLVRPWVESFVFQKSSLSGKDLSARKLEPASGFAALPGVSNVLEGLGLMKRAQDGTPMIESRYANLAQMIPVFARFKNWVYAEPTRSGQRASALASSMLGI